MIEKQKDFCKEILHDLDRVRDELFASLKKEFKDTRKLSGRLPDKFWNDKQKFYTEQMRRIYAMKALIKTRLDSTNLLLRKARIEHGLTQQALAEKAGVSRQWIVHLEAGEINRIISKKVKLRVCEVLGVSYKEAFPIDHLMETLIQKGIN